MGFESTLEVTDLPLDPIHSRASQNFQLQQVQEQVVAHPQSTLQLPSDFLKTSTTLYEPQHYTFALSACCIDLFQNQVQSADIDGRSLLLAAVNILLHRYTQQERIDLELTLSDQPTDLDFTTEINIQLSSESTARKLVHNIADILKHVQNQAEASRTQSQLENQLNSHSHLPVAITFIRNNLQIESKNHWISGFRHRVADCTHHSDLHLIILQQEHSLLGTLKYNANLFRPETIQRLAGHLQVLVESIVQDLDCPIAQLPLLTQAEEQQLLKEWQTTTVQYPAIPIHQVIETHADQQPDAIALSFKDQHLTYAELNQRANQLAHYLQTLGVGAEVRVAVCVEPSLEIAVSLLGIFKAGGVYVPLDPTHPPERLATILADNQPQVLITQSHLIANLPTIAAHSFCIDQDWEIIQHLPTDNLIDAIDLDQTAYIVYTSGTTGKPKGVMASHRNLVNYILLPQARYSFNRDDVMPAIARFTFSITFFELLSPLVAGGRLLILEREHILDFRRMVQTLEQVTVIHTSPSLMRKLLAYIQDNSLDLRRFQGLRHASCGGDIVAADLLETMKTVFSNAEIYVIYGCSEISCMGCTYPVPTDASVTKSRVGKPFNNVAVRLYDPQQNFVPIGVVGEIYIGGAGVTKGYLNRPELTEEKFVTIDSQRFYRTGDLGRFDADGNLEILGRSDFQIQLRGLRMEPGEIEASLRQLPGVRDSVVAAPELSNGEKALVAYVVLDQAQKPTIEQMRRFLQTKLPDYMVPAIFMELEALPLNMNQKVDRRALPAPTSIRTGSGDSYIAPRTPLEALLVDIWTPILGVEQVGVQDDFFALGGHSLMAAQVVYRLQETFHLEIAISRLFELPTIAELADYLTTLSPTEAADRSSSAAITPIQRGTCLPLSFAQSRLWFLTQLEEGIAYNIPLAFELCGELQIPVLEQSLTEIVRRHETLRTTFPIVDGVPVQLILPPQPFTLAIVNLQALPAAEQTAAVYHLAQTEAQTPFQLATDLPMRATLLQLTNMAHVLLLTVHHIVSDGWSLAVLRKEMAALYTAFLQGAVSPLEELPIQYADFTQWQQQWLREEILNRQLTYWKQQLAGVPPLLELPTDRPRPPVQTYRGGTEFLTLDAELTQQLKALSQRAGATLFMTLLAAFGTLLSRYSRQSDLVIGSPIANRNRSELEPLIGFFINLLALRIDLTGNPAFLELLKRVRKVALDAYAHQETPFDQVVEALQPERNLSHSPLFQVLFILQNSPVECLDLPGLTMTPLKVESGTAKYDLTLMMEETEAGLTAEFEYNRDLFDRATITRLIGHFQTLLQGIVADPQQSIATLPLLTAPEHHQLLVEWNRTQMAYPQAPCIHQLFESQVERTPDAIAIVFEQTSLTYRELNQQANQLAHSLRSLGVGPEVLVGICLERSLEMVVGLLGILKAGGSYVPLDPAYPSERLAYMIEDSQLPLLLTQQAFRDQFSTQSAQVICIDADWPAIAQHSRENLNSGVAAENLAYTIYTSGSTGKPKGVQICHRTAVNFLNSMRHKPGLTDRDILLAVTTICFDIAVLELYLPLMVGARIVLAPRTVAADAARLSDLLTKSGATVMQATPATWRLLLSGGWQPDRPLKMLCGGEALSRELADQLLAHGGSLWNLYGPTETTVWSAAAPVIPGIGTVPVAGPIANTQIYVLETLPSGAVQPVPIGIPGEVHIGGAGLARGYLNRPELTQERFIADPFSDRPEARLYKTGDLARFRPDGSLEFLGRMDHQVKLRGFRIELGEIEAVLSRHPAVQQGVVVVREDTPGDQRLVAYLTASDTAPTLPELRQFLKDHLPDYMVPAAFVILADLPLTPNGKVDRRALPAPDVSIASDRSGFLAPRNELEHQLVEIWQAVLRVPSIGIQDNFFELGGHSLSAVRVWAQIEKQLGIALPITTLLQSPTIAELAALIGDSNTEAPTGDIVPLRQGGSQPPLFCVYGVLLYRELAAQLDCDRPVYGVYLQEEIELLKTGKLDQQTAIFSSVPQIAARYLQAIRTIQPHGPYYLAGECFGGIVALEMAQQLQAAGETVAFVGLLDAKAPHHSSGLSLVQRLQLHWHLLLNQGGGYLLKKMQDNLQFVQRRVLTRCYQVYQQLNPASERVAQKWSVAMQQDLREAVRERAIQSYTVQPYCGPVVLFRATERDAFESLDQDLGWKPLLGNFQVFDIPGDHLGILKAPNVQVMAEKLKRYLE